MLALVAALLAADPAPADPAPAEPPPPTPGELALEVAPALKALDIPAVPADLAARTAQYQSTRAARFLDWATGGGVFVSTRFGETAQLHHVASAQGARRQLTFGREPVRGAVAATWQERDGFFYSRDVGGGEAYQLVHFATTSGEHKVMTDGTSRNIAPRRSRDGRRLAFSSTKRNDTDFDIWLLDLDEPTPRLLLEREGYWYAEDWSPDGRELLLRHYVSANESSLHRLDLTTKVVTPVFPAATDRVAFRAARYTKNSRALYVVSNWWGEHAQLSLVDLKTGGARPLTSNIPWDVEALEVAPKGKLVAFVTNEDGVSRLHLWKAKSHRNVKLPALPVGVIGGLKFGPKGRMLAMTIQPATGPADVFVVDTRKRKLARWTSSELGGLDPATMVAPTLVRYPTFDDVDGAKRQIPAFYYKPPGDGPFPVVISIHGGPESQYRPRFSSTLQFWVRELGIAVLAPNVRGSAGYGKGYLLLDNGVLREDSVKDIGALLDWIGGQPELDASRVGVYGGSYGGYMVLASLARYPKRIRAGAEIVGISNFVTFLENTKPYRRDLRRAEYGDERDPAMRKHLTSISPTMLSDHIISPLFVAQGLNDPRVPASESEQIVTAARRRNVPCWYLLAEDEGHGFRKKKNRDYYTNALALFWSTWLLAETP